MTDLAAARKLASLEARLRDRKPKRSADSGLHAGRVLTGSIQKFSRTEAKRICAAPRRIPRRRYILTAGSDIRTLERSYDARFYAQEGLGSLSTSDRDKLTMASSVRIMEEQATFGASSHWSWVSIYADVFRDCQSTGDEIRVLENCPACSSNS